jgi:hypothetical protein
MTEEKEVRIHNKEYKDCRETAGLGVKSIFLHLDYLSSQQIFLKLPPPDENEKTK